MNRLCLYLLLFSAASAFAQKSANLDETAHFLAGLPVTGTLAPLTNDPAWQDHAAALNVAWRKKEYRQLGRIRAWMAQNAPAYYRSSNTVFYMFGGPDFLYANLFFPNANTYILAGLEPVGQVPDLSRVPPDTIGHDLTALRASMHTILQTHYFITKEMRAELGPTGGTLPILYVFLARAGATVLDTTYLRTPAEGVKITFTRGRGRVQTLYYFKTDLSGGGGTPFLRWCAAQAPGMSLLKAASYLMHDEGFAGVREFLLTHSTVIVQDDSGIPLHAFGKNWTVDCFGRYVPHKEMFDKFYQKDVAAIYAKEPPPPALGFPFGYHWQKDRGILMLATRK